MTRSLEAPGIGAVHGLRPGNVRVHTAFEDRVARYELRWREIFDVAVRSALAPGFAVLDVGGGRAPAIAACDRPPDCTYVGLDISEDELRRAGSAAYDRVVVGDISVRDSSLENSFDLAVSWQVLEHVEHLDRALENVRSYLRADGAFVAHFSGKFSAFALVNQMVPQRLGLFALERLKRRPRGTVFPAFYDKCHAGALKRLLSPWSRADVVPRFRGASYFSFSPKIERVYLRYEDWAMRAGHANLATHYLVIARR